LSKRREMAVWSTILSEAPLRGASSLRVRARLGLGSAQSAPFSLPAKRPSLACRSLKKLTWVRSKESEHLQLCQAAPPGVQPSQGRRDAEEMKRLEYQKDLGAAAALWDQLWSEIKNV
jgi:hypothetical protein